MRNLARVVLVAATLSVLPTASADAVYCREPLTEVCNTLCDINRALGRPCLR